MKEQVEAVAILFDAARQWVEKQGLLPHSDELPLSESFPSNGGLIMAAKEARYDKEALNKFFGMLIRRRYFSDELPSSSSAWSLSPAPSQRLDESTSDEDQFYKRASLREGYPYKNNTLPPRNLTQPPTIYPQQPVSTTDLDLGKIPGTEVPNRKPN